MEKLHFIWWGPFMRLSCEFPLLVADGAPDLNIMFWCKDSAMDEFRRAFAACPSITVTSCSSVKAIVGNRYAESRRLWRDAQSVLRQLDAYRAFAAVKDLMSFIIMHVHGGYYLDLTARPAQGAGVAGLRRQMAIRTDHPRMAQTVSGEGSSVFHVVGWATLDRMTRPQGFSATDKIDPELKRFVVVTRSVDVWCLYSPPGHEVFRVAAESYVERATRFGIYVGAPSAAPGRAVMSDPLSRDAITKIADEAERTRQTVLLNKRNYLIGQLAIRSALDAFLTSGIPDFGIPFRLGENLKRNSDGTTTLVNTGLLEGWDIVKHFAGSWRGEAASSNQGASSALATAPPR